MKKYCVDLEIARELKENGFPQKGYYWWHCYKGKDFCIEQNTIQYRENEQIPCDSGLAIDYVAPTSDELLEHLPAECKIKGYRAYLDILCYPDFYQVRYYIVGNKFDLNYCEPKLSNALAKMCIYLKKEGYINE